MASLEALKIFPEVTFEQYNNQAEIDPLSVAQQIAALALQTLMAQQIEQYNLLKENLHSASVRADFLLKIAIIGYGTALAGVSGHLLLNKIAPQLLKEVGEGLFGIAYTGFAIIGISLVGQFIDVIRDN